MLALAGDGGADGTRGSGPSETISQAMRVGCRVAACTLTSIYPHIVEMPSEVSCAPPHSEPLALRRRPQDDKTLNVVGRSCTDGVVAVYARSRPARNHDGRASPHWWQQLDWLAWRARGAGKAVRGWRRCGRTGTAGQWCRVFAADPGYFPAGGPSILFEGIEQLGDSPYHMDADRQRLPAGPLPQGCPSEKEPGRSRRGAHKSASTLQGQAPRA